ncbi:MAG: HD-GYP domain-containing protein [Vicinamibacterales bacterium]
MTIIEQAPWRKSDRELRLMAIFTDAGIASSDALLALLAVLYRERPDDLAHVQRVGQIAVRIGCELGLTDRDIADIERAAWVHDLGKLVIPERIDTDGDGVSRADIDRWTEQLLAVRDILDGAPALRAAAALVMASRECIDGTGFPGHLAGNEIPLGARILHVADTYDALQELCAVFSMPTDSVNVELVRHAGTRFDAAVVAAWLRLVDEQAMQSVPRPGQRARSAI